MESPEDWNFPNPHPQISLYQNEGRAALADKIGHLDDNFMTTQTTVFVPDTLALPQEAITRLNADSEFYSTQTLKGELIFRRDFIANFVLLGGLTICPTRGTTPYALYVFPNGLVIIRMDKELSKSLGISFGTHVKETRGKYALLGVNLKEMYSNTKRLAKLADLFVSQKLTVSNQEYRFAWIPQDPSICPSSIAKYFHDHGTTVREVAIEYELKRFSNHVVPVLPANHQRLEDVVHLETCLGASLLGIDPAQCSIPDESLRTSDSSILLQFNGLLTKSSLIQFIQDLRTFLQSKPIPYCVLILRSATELPSLTQSKLNKFSHYPKVVRDTRITLIVQQNGSFTWAQTSI